MEGGLHGDDHNTLHPQESADNEHFLRFTKRDADNSHA